VTTGVVITGLGFVTSIGHSRRAVSQSLRSLAHGLSPWQPVADLDLDVKVGGLLSGFDLSSSNPAAWSWPEEFELDPATSRAMPPHGVYALAAVQQALEEAHLSDEELCDGATGLYCASAGSPRMTGQHLDKLRSSGWRRAHPHAVISSAAGSLNFHLAALLGIRGASCGFISACSSGSHALGYAMDEIRLGRQERIIVVAAEDLNAESTLPFSGMGALSTQSEPRLASRPFDRGRDGFVANGWGDGADPREYAERGGTRSPSIGANAGLGTIVRRSSRGDASSGWARSTGCHAPGDARCGSLHGRRRLHQCARTIDACR
jgi:3-oxoacyl-(acyl-carrier-protein) synthase